MTYAQQPSPCNTTTPLDVTITPDDVSICNGNSVDLTAEVSGGEGAFPRVFYTIGEDPDSLFAANLGNFSGTNTFKDQVASGPFNIVAGEWAAGELFGIASNGLFGKIDSMTGSIVPIDNINNGFVSSWVDLGFDSNSPQTMYVIGTNGTDSRLYKIDRDDGDLHFIDEFDFPASFFAVDNDGIGWVGNEDADELYRIDNLSSGEVTYVGETGISANVKCASADVDPLNNTLYAVITQVPNGSETSDWYELDKQTGDATQILPTMVHDDGVCAMTMLNDNNSAYQYAWSTGDDTKTISVNMPGTYSVTVTDACGTDATDDVDVGFYSGGSISCHGTQNVSVDENCTALITPEMMVTGSYSCVEDFTVHIEDEYGNPVPNPVPGSYVGETLYVTVHNQDHSNECWGEVYIEDKMGPTISCSDTTVVCYMVDNIPLPYANAEDNCTGIDTILVDEEVDSQFPGCQGDTIKRIYRTYVAVDQNGAVSAPCTQTVNVLGVEAEDVVAPDDTVVFYCDDVNGTPGPELTGAPTVNGTVNLWEIKNQVYCNYFIDYQDGQPQTVNCETRVTRTWIINNFFANGGPIGPFSQTIIVRDTTGPQLTCPDIPSELTKNMQQCMGTFFVPKPEADENCNNLERIDLVIESEWLAPPVPVMTDFQGGFVQLPAGPSTLKFRAYDNCYNSDSCSVEVNVLDQQPPIPVCDQHTVVSLNQDGQARVYANTFDDGSLDDCMLDSFGVARMDGPDYPEDEEFGPYVEFDCEDQATNPNTVVFRVYDMAGNTNDCMVEVEVQDKIGATLTCPPNVTVSCEYPLDTNDLSVFGTVHELDSMEQLLINDPREDVEVNDPGNTEQTPQPYTWGEDGIAYDNCGVTVTEDFEIDSTNDCGSLVLTRTFTAMGPGGPIDECTQTITVKNFDPFIEGDIAWPKDVTIYGDCSPQNLSPSVQGTPQYSDGPCELVGDHYTDWQFNFVPGNNLACYKIIRTWEVIDWCQYNSSTDEGIWSHDQVIKIVDTVGPQFSSAARDTSLCSTASCTMIPFSLSKAATDQCTETSELFWEYHIDLNSGGVWAESDQSGNTNFFNDDFPVGTHSVRWRVEDRCGNIRTQTEHFTLSSCKAPSASCQNINSVLTLMEVNGDSLIMTMVETEDVDLNSEAFCGQDVTLSFDPNIQPGDQPKDTVLFDCDDIGDQVVTLYVFDQNWNSSSCNATVNVQDNDSLCNNGTGSSVGIVGGHIQTKGEQDMSDVQISLNGAGMGDVMTDSDGRYSFPAMTTGGEDYEVIPSHDQKPLNGVSTYDLVLIQKHVLGVNELVSPYQQIAADVNKNGDISAADMVELRQLILGIYDEFQHNESWRFVDKYYTFTTNNAASEDFPESYYINQFNGTMSNIDFIGVKIGDINGSVKMDNFGAIDDRSGEQIAFEFTDRTYRTGDDVEIPVYAGSYDQLLGYQFTLDYDEESLLYTGIDAGSLPVSDDYIGFPSGYEGVITMSWNDVTPVAVDQQNPLFTLTFKAVQSGDVHNAFRINSDVTRAEAYTKEGETRPVALDFRGEGVSTDAFALHQNIPNPFDRTTRIGFNLPKASEATLTVFDLTGKVIREIKGEYSKGYNEIRLNKSDLSAEGVMYYQLSTGKYTATKKMIMVE